MATLRKGPSRENLAALVLGFGSYIGLGTQVGGGYQKLQERLILGSQSGATAFLVLFRDFSANGKCSLLVHRVAHDKCREGRDIGLTKSLVFSQKERCSVRVDVNIIETGTATNAASVPNLLEIHNFDDVQI